MNNLLSISRKFYIHLTSAISFIAMLLVIIIDEANLVHHLIGGIAVVMIILHVVLSFFVMSAFKYKSYNKINLSLVTGIICMLTTMLTVLAASPMHIGIVSLSYIGFLFLGLLINLLQK